MTTNMKRPVKRLAFAAAAVMGGALAVTAVLAGNWETSIEAVKQATQEELLAELQRRQDARRALSQPAPAPANRSILDGGRVMPLDSAPVQQEAAPPPSARRDVITRSAATGLGSIDEVELITALHFNARTVYGVDDRREWHQINDQKVRRIANATVALFPASFAPPAASGDVKLKLSTLGEDMGLCPGETFSDQATGSFCSGTLVREDVVLTAGHCVREIANNPKLPAIGDVSFVFGYRVETAGSSGPQQVPAANVFKGKQVLDGQLLKGEDRDWALVQLDRPVPKTVAEPVTGWRKPAVAKGQKVFVVGYPSGLPMKYAPGAEVLDTSNPVYFLANLDTFGGNSGSGVFDQSTNELVGILVRGGTDYVQDRARGCYRTFACPKSGCKGEGVTRISLVPAP